MKNKRESRRFIVALLLVSLVCGLAAAGRWVRRQQDRQTVRKAREMLYAASEQISDQTLDQTSDRSSDQTSDQTFDLTSGPTGSEEEAAEVESAGGPEEGLKEGSEGGPEEGNRSRDMEGIETGTKVETGTESETETETDPVTGADSLAGCSLAALQAVNPDVVGWIRYPGTAIDHPVMQSADNRYYLYRDVTGSSSSSGTPFMDWKNDIGGELQNYVIYSHHYAWGTAMFTTLTRAAKQSFVEKYPCLYLLLSDGLYECRIFAVRRTDTRSGFDTCIFSSQEEKQAYIDAAIADSVVSTDVKVTSEDLIVTLVTCDKVFGGEHGRLAVSAKMERIE